jgi:hypothetical protein
VTKHNTTIELSNEQAVILRMLSAGPILVSKSYGKIRALTQLTNMGFARLFPGGHPPKYRITQEGRAALNAYRQPSLPAAPVEIEIEQAEPVALVEVASWVPRSVPRNELIDVVLLSLDDMTRHIGLLQQAVSELRNQHPNH